MLQRVIKVLRSPIPWVISPYERHRWQRPFDVLRAKWVQVPTTRSGSMRTDELLALPDAELLAVWSRAREDITTGGQFAHRGWYHILYADAFGDKKILDVGCGFAIDGITFAQHGAKVAFVDIVESNVQVVRRLCGILGLQDVDFLFMQDIGSLVSLDSDFDVVMCLGSLHHAPFEVVRPEAHELLRHLKIGGRWIQLAYPKTRWLRDGSPPFDQWGARTDGPGTPWAEWYDLPKLLRLLEPARFEVVLCQEFHNSDFIWFDLLYQGQKAEAHTDE